jgi:hypothetical protein
MKFAARIYCSAIVFVSLFSLSLPVLAAGGSTVSISTFSIVDSSANYHKTSLSGEWEYKTSDAEEWQRISLPHSLNQRGQFAVRRVFTIDSSLIADSYQLLFDGIYGACTIYLNKKILGGHGNNAAPFSFDIAREFLAIGEQNELMIEIDNRLDFHHTVPLAVGYRGLPPNNEAVFRDVSLVANRKPFIYKISLAASNAEFTSPQSLSIQIWLKNKAVAIPDRAKKPEGPKLIIELFETNNEKPVWRSPVNDLSAEDFSAQYTAPLDQPKLWIKESPNVYLLKATVADRDTLLHQARLSFGLRKVDISSGFIRLNGQRTQLKVIPWIDDLLNRRLPADTLNKKIDADLQTVLALGANAVRVFAGLPPPHLLASCDRLGLAVLAEIPVVNVPPALLEDPQLFDNAVIALSDLIKAFKDHPCIIAWGVGSGYDAGDVRTRRFVQRLYDVARQLDDRPVYAGVRGQWKSSAKLPVDLQIIEILPEDLERLSAQDKAMIPSNANVIFQIAAILPRSESLNIDERNQASSLKNALKSILDDNRVAGVIVNPLRDWKGSTPHLYWGPRRQANLFMAGLLDSFGSERPAYQSVKAIFNGTPPPNLMPTRLNDDEPLVFKLSSLGLLVILLITINRDRRMRLYLRRVFFYPHGFYMDLNENRQVSGFLTSLVGFSIFITISVFVSSLAYYFRFSSYFDEILTWLWPDPTIKFRMLWFVWNPVSFVLAFTLLLAILAVLQIILLKIMAIIQGRYMKLSQLAAFVLWVPANLLLSLPVAIIFYRALGKPQLVAPILIYLGVLLLWFVVRTFRGTKVILQLTVWKTIVLYFGTLLAVLFTIGIYLENSRAIMAFAQYYRHLIGI